jgi:hypothetical protein
MEKNTISRGAAEWSVRLSLKRKSAIARQKAMVVWKVEMGKKKAV